MRVLDVRTVMLTGLGLLWVMSCSSEPPAPVDPVPAVAEEPPTDMILARARASLHARRIDPKILTELRASDTPAHRRAVRVLDAMTADPALLPAAEPSDAELSTDTPTPTLTLTTAPPEPIPRSSRGRKEVVAPKAAPGSPRKSATPRATLNGVGLAKTSRGAALSLRGSGGFVVGVASQPSSGIVRLVMEAEVSSSALRARPKVTGARVTGIRRTGKSLFVTLALDPGWSLHGIVKTRGGARVDLRRPA